MTASPLDQLIDNLTDMSRLAGEIVVATGGKQSDFVRDLDRVLGKLRKMLIEKNTAYGNSALAPVRVFSKADPVEQLKVRIDDKLSRIVRGQAAGEDVEDDLLGYLVLLQMARLKPE